MAQQKKELASSKSSQSSKIKENLTKLSQETKDMLEHFGKKAAKQSGKSKKKFFDTSAAVHGRTLSQTLQTHADHMRDSPLFLDSDEDNYSILYKEYKKIMKEKVRTNSPTPSLDPTQLIANGSQHPHSSKLENKRALLIHENNNHIHSHLMSPQMAARNKKEIIKKRFEDLLNRYEKYAANSKPLADTGNYNFISIHEDLQHSLDDQQFRLHRNVSSENEKSKAEARDQFEVEGHHPKEPSFNVSKMIERIAENRFETERDEAGDSRHISVHEEQGEYSDGEDFENPYLQNYEIIEAATVFIQKNFRGYRTRKMLREYFEQLCNGEEGEENPDMEGRDFSEGSQGLIQNGNRAEYQGNEGVHEYINEESDSDEYDKKMIQGLWEQKQAENDREEENCKEDSHSYEREASANKSSPHDRRTASNSSMKQVRNSNGAAHTAELNKDKDWLEFEAKLSQQRKMEGLRGDLSNSEHYFDHDANYQQSQEEEIERHSDHEYDEEQEEEHIPEYEAVDSNFKNQTSFSGVDEEAESYEHLPRHSDDDIIRTYQKRFYGANTKPVSNSRENINRISPADDNVISKQRQPKGIQGQAKGQPWVSETTSLEFERAKGNSIGSQNHESINTVIYHESPEASSIRHLDKNSKDISQQNLRYPDKRQEELDENNKEGNQPESNYDEQDMFAGLMYGTQSFNPNEKKVFFSSFISTEEEKSHLKHVIEPLDNTNSSQGAIYERSNSDVTPNKFIRRGNNILAAINESPHQNDRPKSETDLMRDKIVAELKNIQIAASREREFEGSQTNPMSTPGKTETESVEHKEVAASNENVSLLKSQNNVADFVEEKSNEEHSEATRQADEREQGNADEILEETKSTHRSQRSQSSQMPQQYYEVIYSLLCK